jgi:hypothetical protein
MTNDDGNPHAEISAHYLASAVEVTPAELDRKILRQASAEVRNSSSVGWALSWLRPATFVATLGITVALLLEFGQYESVAPEMSDQIATLNAESMPANKRSTDGDAFRGAVNAAAKQVRDIDASADVKLKEMPSSEDFGASVGDTLQDMPTAEGAVATAEAPAAALTSATATGLPQCSNAQRQNPADWWLCIAELRDNGFRDAAELETEEFQQAFPDYVAQ